MLAEKRRRHANRCPGRRKLYRDSGHADRSSSGIIDFVQHFAMAHLRRIKNFIDGLNRRTGNFGLVQKVQPRIRIASDEYFSQNRYQSWSILDSLGILRKARIVGEIIAI